MKKLIKSALLLLAVAALFGSCNPEEEVIPITGLKIVNTNPTVFVDSLLQLDLVITPSNSNAEITWSSNSPEVAEVDNSGCVKGISKGSAIINAISGTSVASAIVNVYNNPCTVQLTLDGTTSTTATVTAKVSDEEGYYYCGYATRSEVQKKKDSELTELIMNSIQTTIKQYAAYGMQISIADLLMQGSKQLTASGLEPSTEYTLFAFGIDVESMLCSSVSRIDCKTQDVVPSSNVFQFAIDSISGTKVYFTVTPSNDDPYACQIASSAQVAQQGGAKGFMEYARQYFNTYLSSYGGWDAAISTGVLHTSLSSAKDSTEYTIIAAGFEGGWTTEFQTYTFTYYAPKESTPEAAPARKKDNEINYHFVEFDPSFIYMKNRFVEVK